MLNEYVFDYRLVFEEDPSFEEFINITNLLKHRDKHPITALINALRDDNNDETENEIINFAHDKKDELTDNIIHSNAFHTDWDTAQKEERMKHVELKQRYIDPPNPNYNSSTLQLLPPNRFLLPSSKILQGEDTLYMFTRSNIFDINNFVCLINKYRFSQKDNFIRLQHAIYRFDRKRNVTSELKKHLTMWTYNTKTKQLYRINKVKKDPLKRGSHFHNSVKKVFNTLSNAGLYTMPEQITNKFINAILKAAKKDVPDIVTLDNKSLKSEFDKVSPTDRIVVKREYIEKLENDRYQLMNLAAAILQHRVGQPIKWLNYTLAQNIWNMLSDLHFQEKILSGSYNYYNNNEQGKGTTLKAKALRKKTVYQLIPNLRKSNHMKTAIKTILGEGYSKFFIRVFNEDSMNSTFLSEWLSAANKDLISKNLYHWVVQTINVNNSHEIITHITTNVARILELISRNHNELRGYDNTSDWNQFPIILDSYIKVYKKIAAIDVDLPGWHTWHDMYNMANQLGIRIRPNKLNSTNEIKRFHDKLSDIINRDRVTIKKYRNSVFEEFISPTKKYDGFEFIQMRTAQDLVDEGTTMHHCVGSYADRCANGRSIIFSMRKDGKGYVTIDLDTATYKVKQQYTLHDITVTSQEALDIIDKWDSDCIELHKNDKESYYEICQKKVKDYLDKEREKTLKELVKDGMANNESQILKSYQHEGEEALPRAAAI